MTKDPCRFYVYAYLRSKDSESGRKYSPYYIGKGQNNRAFSKNRLAPPPRDKSFIVFIQEGLTEEEAFKLEAYCISLYGRINISTGILRNLTDGGEGTLGTKRVFNKETRIKMSEGAKGNKNMLGKKFSQEHKLNLSESHKGYKVKDEVKDKISKSMIGIKNRQGTKLSENHKAKLINGWIGKNHSAESKDKIALKNGTKIINNRTGKIYLSISRLANDLELSNYKVKQLIGNNLNYSYYGIH